MARVFLSTLAVAVVIAGAVLASGAALADPKTNYTLFSPNGVQLRAPGGGTSAGSGFNPDTLSRSLQPSEPSARLNKIDSFTIKQKTIESHGDPDRPFILGPTSNPAKSPATGKRPD